MTKSQEPTVAIRGTWPLPVDRFSWLVAGLLLVLLIIVYYRSFYPRLEAANNSAHIFSEPQYSNQANGANATATDLELKVASPRFISDLTRQTLLLGVTNPQPVAGTEATDESLSIAVVPKLRLLCVSENGVTVECGDEAGYYVFLDTPDDSQPTLRQGGYLLFSDIPAGASVSQELIVEVVGLTQALDGETKAAEPPVEREVEIEFLIFDVVEGRPEENADGRRYSPKEPLRMEIDSTRAVVQGIMSFLLLPPWANGFVPFVAVFTVYLFGVSEALRCFLPRDKPKKTQAAADEVEVIVLPQTPPSRRARFKAAMGPGGTHPTSMFAWLVFWLLLMTGVALLALWVMTEVAVVFLADEESLLAIVLGVLLVLAVVAAVVIDWKVIRPSETKEKPDEPTAGNGGPQPQTINAAAITIQSPNGQPLTMPVNATAVTIQSPDGQPLTMPVNATAITIQSPDGQPLTMPVNAAVTIQSPDGQPLTMPVNAGALTVQLNGELFEHCKPHPCPQAAAPVVELVVEPPTPPAGQAAPVVEQAAPVVEQAAPSPEQLALEAKVSQLEAQLAAVQAALAAVADSKPPKRKRNPKPKPELPAPDIPPQPTSLPPREEGIFGPPPPTAETLPAEAAPPAAPAVPSDAPPPRKDDVPF